MIVPVFLHYNKDTKERQIGWGLTNKEGSVMLLNKCVF